MKTTITVDPENLAAARRLSNGRSASAVIDLALRRLVQQEEARRHVAAYAANPPAGEEAALGKVPVRLDLGDDDIDYDAIYGRRT